MAARLSADGGCGGCYRRPNQQARAHLTSRHVKKKSADAVHVCACARARVGENGEKHTLCQSQRRRGSTLAAFCSVT